MSKTILTTERLLLRATLPSDVEPLHRLVFSEHEVMRHTFGGKAMSLEEAEQFCQRLFDFEATGQKIATLTLKEDSTIVGFAGLTLCSALNESDLELGKES